MPIRDALMAAANYLMVKEEFMEKLASELIRGKSFAYFFFVKKKD